MIKLAKMVRHPTKTNHGCSSLPARKKKPKDEKNVPHAIRILFLLARFASMDNWKTSNPFLYAQYYDQKNNESCKNKQYPSRMIPRHCSLDGFTEIFSHASAQTNGRKGIHFRDDKQIALHENFLRTTDA